MTKSSFEEIKAALLKFDKEINLSKNDFANKSFINKVALEIIDIEKEHLYGGGESYRLAKIREILEKYMDDIDNENT